MSFEIKESKTMLTHKHIYLRKIHKEEKVTLEKFKEKRQNYVQTPQGNPIHEKTLIHRIK